MSNEPGGPPPERNPFAAPEDGPKSPDATRPLPPPPSGYEAVPPAGSWTPSSSGPPAYGDPGAGQQPGYGQATPPQGATGPQRFAPPSYGQQPYAPPPGQPGQPGYAQPTAYGQPGYGAPQQYGYGPGYGQPTRGTDTLAVASFATSTGGLLLTGGLVSAVGLGLGIASLRRIKRTGQEGRGFALAGVVIGAVGTFLFLAGVVLFFVFFAALGASGGLDTAVEQFNEGFEEGMQEASPDDPGYWDLRDDLTVATCLAEYPTQYDMSDAEVVPCAEPHDTEIVAQVTLDAPATDEEDPAYYDAVDACVAEIEALSPGLFDVGGFADVYFSHPSDFEAPGGSTAFCTYTADEANLTGSIVVGDVLVGGQGVGS